MILNIKGKNGVLKDLEEAERLIKEARDIIYRLPTAIKITVEDDSEKANCSQDTQ